MSLSTDVLSRATPTRLICRAGRWVLELTRLEAVDRDVFQPRLQRLEGTESILALLRRSDDGHQLAAGAAQLMRGARAEEDRAFEANGSDWVPSADAPLAARASETAYESDDLAGVVAELRAELLVLRASHSRLRDRVMALEAAQNGIPGAHGRALRGSRARRRSEPPPALETEQLRPAASPAAQVGFEATQASPGLSPPAAVAPAAAPPPARAAARAVPPSLAEVAKILGGEMELPALGLPAPDALNECLRSMMESAPPLQRLARPPALDTLAGPKACRLMDEEGRERGALVLDVTAAALLGSALLALPREEALEQARENRVSADALLAVSEICNCLAAPINAVAGNPQIHVTALEDLDVAALPKLRARLELGVEEGVLVVAMF